MAYFDISEPAARMTRPIAVLARQQTLSRLCGPRSSNVRQAGETDARGPKPPITGRPNAGRPKLPHGGSLEDVRPFLWSTHGNLLADLARPDMHRQHPAGNVRPSIASPTPFGWAKIPSR